MTPVDAARLVMAATSNGAPSLRVREGSFTSLIAMFPREERGTPYAGVFLIETPDGEVLRVEVAAV